MPFIQFIYQVSQEVVVPDVPGLGGYDNNNVGEEVLSRLAHQTTANYPTSVRMDKEAILAATAAASAGSGLGCAGRRRPAEKSRNIPAG